MQRLIAYGETDKMRKGKASQLKKTPFGEKNLVFIQANRTSRKINIFYLDLPKTNSVHRPKLITPREGFTHKELLPTHTYTITLILTIKNIPNNVKNSCTICHDKR